MGRATRAIAYVNKKSKPSGAERDRYLDYLTKKELRKLEEIRRQKPKPKRNPTLFDPTS